MDDPIGQPFKEFACPSSQVLTLIKPNSSYSLVPPFACPEPYPSQSCDALSSALEPLVKLDTDNDANLFNMDPTGWRYECGQTLKHFYAIWD